MHRQCFVETRLLSVQARNVVDQDDALLRRAWYRIGEAASLSMW